MKTDYIPEREIHWWKGWMPELLGVSACLGNLLVCWVLPFLEYKKVTTVEEHGHTCSYAVEFLNAIFIIL